MKYRFVLLGVVPVIALATALGAGMGQDGGGVGLAEKAGAVVEVSAEDLEGMRQAALDYGEGWYAGDAARMERAVHPDLAKRVLMPSARSGQGEIQHMSGLTIVQMTRAGSGKRTPAEERRTDFTLLDVTGNAAMVKFEMHDWVDYMQMSKVNGSWVIVNVLWEFTDDAKKRYGFPEDY